ncbi:hypothetical protein B0H16DRAFT_1766986 [Mycena metata]|uniref:Uncharacterized protein n=1 Tax=Mycena metata TaxID=1033252 RepID=A0AAD7I4D3_9AGAR|nr:hypothetical protein B0H16DRAFT_1766986 [Mycena metata]
MPLALSLSVLRCALPAVGSVAISVQSPSFRSRYSNGCRVELSAPSWQSQVFGQALNWYFNGTEVSATELPDENCADQAPCRCSAPCVSFMLHHQKGQNVPRPCDYHKATQGPNKAHQRFDPTFLVVTKAWAPLDQASPTFAAPYERLATFLQRFLSLASPLAWGHSRRTKMEAHCFCQPKIPVFAVWI